MVVLLGGVAGWLVLGILLALQRGLLPRRVLVDGEFLPLAPCFEQVPAALALHEALRSRLEAATAVYVFGGVCQGTAEDWPGRRPLRLAALPDLGALGQGLPAEAGAFWRAYSAELGEQETAPNEADFTVLVVGEGQAGRVCALALVQCRSRGIEHADLGGHVRREVRLWGEADLSLSYRFAEPARSDFRIGVSHSWYHRETPLAEGPASVVFPDPWAFAGEQGRGAAVPKFSYFLSVHP
jgi:hypothetical protein